MGMRGASRLASAALLVLSFGTSGPDRAGAQAASTPREYDFRTEFQQSLTGNISQLTGVKALVSLGQYQERLLILDHAGQAPPRLIQQSFASGQRAELLRPVIARDLSGQRKQTFAVPSGQDYSPTSGMGVITLGPRRGRILTVHAL